MPEPGQWLQPDRTGAEQRQRIEVGVSPLRAQMQADRRQAVRVDQLEQADALPFVYPAPHRDQRGHRLIRRLQRTVVDRDDSATGDRPGKGDPPRRRRQAPTGPAGPRDPPHGGQVRTGSQAARSTGRRAGSAAEARSSGSGRPTRYQQPLRATPRRHPGTARPASESVSWAESCRVIGQRGRRRRCRGDNSGPSAICGRRGFAELRARPASRPDSTRERGCPTLD